MKILIADDEMGVKTLFKHSGTPVFKKLLISYSQT